MRTALALLALLFGLTHAQPTFPDVPPGHWAEEALARMAHEGILVGFPDGTFRGDGELNRYEAALMIDRLLSTLGAPGPDPRAAGSAEVRRLRDALDALTERVERLEARPAATGDLRARVDALADEVDRLRADLVEAGLTPPGDAGVPGPAGDAGAAGAPGDPGTAPLADAAPVGPPGDPGGVPEASPSAAEAPTTGDEAPTADRRPWRAALALGGAPDGLPLRASLGHEDLLGFAGLRATVEVPIPDLLEGAAVAAHLTRRFGGPRWSGYGGVGAGYRVAAGEVDPASGAFLGAVLGAEAALNERLGLFLEGAVDWHVGGREGLPDDAGSPVRPVLAAGLAYRF